MTISFTSNGTTSQILHNGTVVQEINAGGLQNLGVSNLAAAAKPLGAGQTWQDVTASRALGTTYTNSTGRAIQVAFNYTGSVAASSAKLTIAGVDLLTISMGASATNTPNACYAVIPAGATYALNQVVATVTLVRWLELR